MSTEVKVDRLPKCNLCHEVAEYDAKTYEGYWAYLCKSHYAVLGVGLGTGLGQRLVPEEKV